MRNAEGNNAVKKVYNMHCQNSRVMFEEFSFQLLFILCYVGQEYENGSSDHVICEIRQATLCMTCN
jgi:hypothetical protein